MFHQTRLKLTAWYLIIIMAISIFFSVVIYLGATEEFDRVLRIQEYRIQHPDLRVRIIPRNFWEAEVIPEVPQPDPQVIGGAKLRVVEALTGINIIILFFSSLAGYFLAGRTLRPIKEMIDEQNRFITDASHELNTPLTSLKTSIEVNLRDKKLDFKKAKNVLLSNLDDVNSLKSLSDELMELTQYEKPNGSLFFEAISIHELINKSVEKIKPLAEKKNISLNISAPKIIIKADERSIVELFVILLDNAIKYSGNGKVVSVKVLKTDAKIKIVVEDKGIGISKEDIKHIFERFYRADKSRTKQNVSGYGLGLAIAKRIVTMHSGNIEIESVVNKGSKFIVTLPVA